MKRVLKVLSKITAVIVILIMCILCYVRFSRTLDPFIYKTNSGKTEFKSLFKHKELMFELNDRTKIHAALFMPDSVAVKATVFHHLGNGMDLNTAQLMYKPLLKDGFQIYAYERRGFGGSTGEDDNTIQLKADALEIFDKFKTIEEVKGTNIIIWGVSLGGIFATTNAAERNNYIKGLVLEGTFSSFPDIADHYASEIKLEHFKWLIPLLLNNDFPTNQEIKKVTKPVVIIHSTEDQLIPFKLGENFFINSNKANSIFWKIKGAHVKGIINDEKEYLKRFDDLLNQ